MKFLNKVFTILIPALILPMISFGQAAGLSQDFVLMAILGVMALTIIVLIAVITVLSSLRRSIKEEEIAKKKEAGIEVVVKPGWWTIFMGSMTDSVPLEEEETVLLDHDYDGIRELDNHLPPWWKYLFYFTIAFGVVYLLNAHVFNIMPSSTEEYEQEMAEAAEAAAARKALLASTEGAFDESNIVFSDDPTHLTNGEQIFVRQCASCHREDGGGGIGPNLTDDYWLHGGSMESIYNTIKYGVVEKGMISWEPLLSPAQMRDVSSYIMTMAGTNPANGKAPQGDLYVPEKEESTEEIPAESESDSTAVETEQEVAGL